MHPEFTLYHMLLNNVERDSHKTAIVDGADSYSYEDLLRASACLGKTLTGLGLSPGDRVGVFLDKSWEAVVSMFGVMQVGGVFVNISPLLHEAQVSHIINDCGVRFLIGGNTQLESMDLPAVDAVMFTGEGDFSTDWSPVSIPFPQDMLDVHDGVHVHATEDDLCTIIYTSGSTGRPKGIMLSHHNLVAGAQIVSTYLKNTPDDRVLSILPFNFDAGLNQLTTMVRVGGTLVLQRSLLPGDILRNLRNHRITGLGGVPSVWILLLQLQRSLLKDPLVDLRYISNTGGMIASPHLTGLRKCLGSTEIYLMYGLTEAFRSTYLPPEDIDKGSSCIGKAIPNTDIWIVDQDGREVAPGETGELIHRGPTVAMGYWGDTEKTDAVYKTNPFAPPAMKPYDKVVYSGDLVKRGEDGYLYFIGRRDELIKIEGFRVSPQDVEDSIYENPAIGEAVVLGKGSIAVGHTIVAIVSPKNGHQPAVDDIRSDLNRRLPHYMVPKMIHILDQLPKTSSGKFDRSQLRQQFAS